MGGKQSKEKVRYHPRLTKVILINRRDFRVFFGIEFANKYGFFIDKDMSQLIHRFADSIEYPKKDCILKGHSARVFGSVVSSDGCYLYTGSRDQFILVWNMMTRQRIHQWRAHEYGVRCLDYDAGYLVSGGVGKTVRVWDVNKDHALKHDLTKHTGLITTVRINKKRDRIVSGSLDNDVRVWSLKTGECLITYQEHTAKIRSVYFIDDLIVSAGENSVQIWDPITGKQRQSPIDAYVGQSWETMSVNCDGSMVACMLGYYGMSLFSWPDMKVIGSSVGFDVYRGCFHPVNPYWIAVTGHQNSSVRVCDVRNGQVIYSVEGYDTDMQSICFTPNGECMIGSSFDIRMWNISHL